MYNLNKTFKNRKIELDSNHFLPSLMFAGKAKNLHLVQT